MRGDGGRIRKADLRGAGGELHIKVTPKRAGALSSLFPLAVRSRSVAVHMVSASVLAMEMSSGFVLKQVPPAEDGLIREWRAARILKAKLLSCI